MLDLFKYIYHIIIFTITYLKNRIRVLRDLLSCKNKILPDQYKTLIVSHSLKGGTDAYLKSLNINNTLLLKDLEYIWHSCYRIVTDKYSAYITDYMMRKILSWKYERIIINSFVKMKNIKNLMLLLINNKKKYPKTQLIYLVHDFHSICPNFNLVCNHDFCQFKCENCNYRKPVVYGSREYVDVREWRKKWLELFCFCEEIRCFSNSSKDIMSKIYPSVAYKITVVPHNVPKVDGEYKMTENNELVVGFFGTINNDAKGLFQTRKLTEILTTFCKIVFVGSTENEIGLQNKNITYIGRYEHNELVPIMNAYHVNIAIFPSIWPETFSYMMSELIQTGIKILSFDIGAQGEKTKDYSNGVVFKTYDEMAKYINNMVRK